ncbi:related to acetylxylan esterase precursor [Fusarium torulosum]|uniref:Related to acetylxylan esterase n=1 Tax=Fusarium torulosum TaxID=33205 RepID=A0AAE8SE07_9HYPO|nr:related to acetylxylan esterase precursor [Fusarium torulosum]
MYSPGPSTPSLIFDYPPRPYNILLILQALTLLIGLVIAQGCDIPSNFTCVSGAHIIAVRGSLEPQGPGIIGAVAQQIMAVIPDSDMTSLRYPAIYEPYKPSQVEGVEALGLAIWQYAAFCPDTKMILLGYSQGAHIVADVMCGTSSVGFPATAPQPPIISSKIAAIVLMGDPSTTRGQPFHIGSSTGDGGPEEAA